MLIPPNLILQDGRVKLEPLQEDHIPLLRNIAMEKSLWLYTSAKVNTYGDYEKYMQTALAEQKNHLAFPFAVFDKLSGNYAGSTRFAAFSWENKRLEIGWTWYGSAYQGSGLNRHCKFLLLSYGFDMLQLNRIELKTSLLNQKSQRAMLGIGAVKEGVLRKHIINEDGLVRDTVYFSFIKEEWQDTKQKYFAGFNNS